MSQTYHNVRTNTLSVYFFAGYGSEYKLVTQATVSRPFIRVLVVTRFLRYTDKGNAKNPRSCTVPTNLLFIRCSFWCGYHSSTNTSRRWGHLPQPYGGCNSFSVENLRLKAYKKTISKILLSCNFRHVALPQISSTSTCHCYKTFFTVQVWLGRQIETRTLGWKMSES